MPINICFFFKWSLLAKLCIALHELPKFVFQIYKLAWFRKKGLDNGYTYIQAIYMPLLGLGVCVIIQHKMDLFLQHSFLNQRIYIKIHIHYTCRRISGNVERQLKYYVLQQQSRIIMYLYKQLDPRFEKKKRKLLIVGELNDLVTNICHESYVQSWFILKIFILCIQVLTYIICFL